MAKGLSRDRDTGDRPNRSVGSQGEVGVVGGREEMLLRAVPGDCDVKSCSAASVWMSDRWKEKGMRMDGI